MNSETVTIIGGGLAGAEAAWQTSRRGLQVILYEMRPERRTPAHVSDRLAEMVCSNSFKSVDRTNAHGLLKEEMRRLGSLILSKALDNRVPAGTALAVDRERFASDVTDTIESLPGITVKREEVTEIPERGIVIIAAGPLISDRLAASLAAFTGQGHLYFYDAIAPVVEAGSIDRSIAFAASRYGKGSGDDYLNCPLDKEAYENLIDNMLQAEMAVLHEFDSTPFFEGCLPVEEMARRGRDTLRFGPMKPVGLKDPETGAGAYAVVQLRQDNLAAEHFSMVGFQTRMNRLEQKRIFRQIPGLQKARFVRLGQVHRNCYINAPAVLSAALQARNREGLFFAGQIAGVEGYMESAASGLLAGMNAARLARGLEPLLLPPETMLGALCHYISNTEPGELQPVNASFGLLPAPPASVRRKKDRRKARADRALRALDDWIRNNGETAV